MANARNTYSREYPNEQQKPTQEVGGVAVKSSGQVELEPVLQDTQVSAGEQR